MSLSKATVAIVVLWCLPVAAVLCAQERWSLCRTEGWVFPDSTPLSGPEGVIEFSADSVRFNEVEQSLTGDNVTMRFGTQRLSADTLIFTARDQHVKAIGNVSLSDVGVVIEGKAGNLYLDTEKGDFTDAKYRLRAEHAHGKADRVRRTGSTKIKLEDATYTTCDPGHVDWKLSANDVTLNQEDGRGFAKNLVLKFKSVPVFYSPVFSFPIDDRRKSGLLTPRFGTSQESGLEFEIPYYWNIAPHRDATFTGRYLDKRGLQLKTEFRYLNEKNNGELQGEYLDDSEDDKQRYLISYRHQGTPARRLVSDFRVNRVSDDEYFTDLGTDISLSSITQLESHANLRYLGSGWNLLTRLQSFQTVDDSVSSRNKPYKRLPQFLLNGYWPDKAFGFEYALRSEVVNFERSRGPKGVRLDLMPGLIYPVVKPAFFFIPSIKLRYTHYNLRDESDEESDSADRTLPITTVDTGLLLERTIGEKSIQTLEPRLYYLYVPNENQDDIPIFDTGQLDFSFGQLFRDDRFSGADRVGDANQLTLALTTRLLDTATGHESLRASIGEILYFRDRKVTLPGGEQETSRTSDFAAELGVKLRGGWNARSSLVWGVDRQETSRATAELIYAPEPARLLSLGYRYRRDDPELTGLENLQQTDVAFSWPLGRRWQAVGRWNYSIEGDRNVELLGGLEYKSCCWSFRLVSRRFLLGDEEEEYNNAIYFEWVLKGLARIGDNIDQLLSRELAGYQTDD